MGKRGLLRLVLQGGAELKTPLKNDNDFDRVIKLLEWERKYMAQGKNPEAEPTAPKKPSKRYTQHTPSVQDDFDFSVLEDFE